jgi:predicted amidohydrolase
MEGIMKIALAQTQIIWNSPEENIENCQSFLEKAHAVGTTLLVFPEMFNTGFSFPVGELANQAESLGHSFLEESARQTGMYVAASMPKIVPPDSRPFNTLYLYGPEGYVGEYSKIHLISALGEDQVYQGGNKPFTVQIDEFRVSFFICYDLRFPYLFSSLAEQTDLFVVVANWPASRQAHWETLLAARAIENQAYVAGVNRCGEGGGLNFAGGSKIISPLGEVIASAQAEQQLLIQELDIDGVHNWRSDFKCLQDRMMGYSALRS